MSDQDTTPDEPLDLPPAAPDPVEEPDPDFTPVLEDDEHEDAPIDPITEPGAGAGNGGPGEVPSAEDAEPTAQTTTEQPVQPMTEQPVHTMTEPPFTERPDASPEQHPGAEE